MAQYVLLFRGKEPRQADLDLIEQSPEIRIVDSAAARALLVDAPADVADRLREQLQDWLVAEEVTHPAPGPARPSVREDPDQGPK